MLKWIYLLFCLISIFETIFYSVSTPSKINKKYLYLFSFATLACVSYTIGTFGKTLEGLYYANLMYNIGSIMGDIFLLLVIAELCHFHIPKIVSVLIFLYGVVIILLVALCRYNPLYYRSISYAQYAGVSYLKKVYGPLHVLLYILLFGFNLFSLFIVMYSLIKNAKVSIQMALIIIIIFTINTLSYAVTRIIHFPLDVLPFTITINCGIMLSVLNRLNMYDMSANLLNVYEQRSDYGYIAFDRKKRFMGCNDYAVKLFPSLDGLLIDSYVPKDNERIQNEIFPWLEAWIQGGKKDHVSVCNGYTAVCSIRFITFRKRQIGYLIELKDVSKQQDYINKLNDFNIQLQGEVETKNEKLIKMQSCIISGMACMVEGRDNSTGEHVQRTSAAVAIFMKHLKESPKYSTFSDEFCNDVVQSAIMHDLGKIAVDDAVLKKQGKFTKKDYEMMKKHSEEGAIIVARVLKDVDDSLFKDIAINVAHYHHERWDGTGYPKGLKGTEIPIEARIMALADVFDALVSKRCYKEALSFDEAFGIIKDSLGSHFDPDLGEIFIECRPQLEILYINEQ